MDEEICGEYQSCQSDSSVCTLEMLSWCLVIYTCVVL